MGGWVDGVKCKGAEVGCTLRMQNDDCGYGSISWIADRVRQTSERKVKLVILHYSVSQ